MNDAHSALLDRHGLRLPARALGRFLDWYAALDDRLRRCPADDDEALVEFALEEDLRGPLFKLEGLYRVYRQRHPRPVKRLLRRIKRLEDLLGLVDYSSAMSAAATDRGFPEPMLKLLEQGCRAAREGLVHELRERGWIDGPRPARAVRSDLKRLIGIDWDGAADDTGYVARELAQQLKGIQRTDYPMDHLESGVHELRRDLRWLPICLTALGDFAVLDPELNPVPDYEPLLEGPYATSPYAQLPEDDLIASPVRIPRSLYVANTKAIDELGDIKDQGQIIEALTAICAASKVKNSMKRAHRYVCEVLELPEDTLEKLLADGRRLYDELREHDLVGEMRRAIRRRS